MGNFNRGGGGGPRRDFGRRDSGRSGFGDRGGGRSFGGGGNRGGDREMFSAVCSNCGKDCQVPFRPTGSKPVYCSDCFEKKSGGDRGGRFEDRGTRPNFERRSDQAPQNNAQIEAINRKLDKILDLLAKPEVAPESAPASPIVKAETKTNEAAPEKVVTPKKPKTPKKKASTKKE